jgi:Capsule polysaccharide export protein
MKDPRDMNQMTPIRRKLRKLQRDPRSFLIDSKGFKVAEQGAKRTWKQMIRLGSFMWVVAIFFLALIYYTAIASDRFVSEAKVVVRQADSIKAVPDISLLGLSGSNNTDIQLVQEYLKSLEMLKSLDQRLQLKQHYQSSSADWFSRLPSNATQEDFYDYYNSHISLSLDSTSGVLTIQAQAFTPEFAQKIVNNLIELSEKKINGLSHKIAAEQVQFVEREITKTYDRLQKNRGEILDFQNKHQLVSPEGQTQALQGVINELQAELVRQQAEYKRLTSFMNSSAPEVVALKDRIDALNHQLEQEQKRLTNQDSPALNEMTADFQNYKVQAELATDLYKTGLTSLEQARVEAYRKLKFLQVITDPEVAEDAKYPERGYNLATLAVLLCVFYGLLMMVVATIREHQD